MSKEIEQSCTCGPNNERLNTCSVHSVQARVAAQGSFGEKTRMSKEIELGEFILVRGASKFKVGDRIRIYGFDSDDATLVLARTVVSVSPNLIETDGGEFCHPKQCRRLVKKQRRRVWILEDDLVFDSDGTSDCLLSTEKLHPTDIEFIEVKKRGG